MKSDDLFSTFHDVSRRRKVLLSVCRRWRTITTSTPRLWAAIDLSGPYVIGPRTLRYFADRTTPYLPPDVIDKHWQRIDQAIQRAGSVPLSIAQSFASPRYYRDVALQDTEMSIMLQRLVELLPRTQDVNLQFHSVDFDDVACTVGSPQMLAPYSHAASENCSHSFTFYCGRYVAVDAPFPAPSTTKAAGRR